MTGSARAVALELVRRVTDEGAYSNLLLPRLLQRSDLTPRDRALTTELAYGTLRKLIPVDLALARLVERPLASAPPPARAALRLGAYQLLYMRIPAHAAVGETVGLVPAAHRGFVNAVLRRLAAEGKAAGSGQSAPATAISRDSGLSEWAVEELLRLLGEEAPTAAAAVTAPGPLTLRVNTCATSLEVASARLRESGHEPIAGRISSRVLNLTGAGSPAELPGFSDGWFAVQDEASAYVVDVLDPQPSDAVLDACAGPGGKAADIACRSGSVVAADRTLGRVELVRATATRLGVDASLLVQDAAVPALRAGFDRILVDAPCSGIGAARRRPELLWRPERKDLSRLARLQVRIALGAASLLRPGGVLVYSVCTFPRAETDAACDALLGRAPFLRPDAFPGPDGERVERARLWPHRHGTDAMFVARFRRSGE